ncbi:MAG: hypothetical protein LBQ88_02035 [Treponema sp.]|jgi:hypothetical protein|nr:hypothetical protein [Treponema sp.]
MICAKGGAFLSAAFVFAVGLLLASCQSVAPEGVRMMRQFQTRNTAIQEHVKVLLNPFVLITEIDTKKTSFGGGTTENWFVLPEGAHTITGYTQDSFQAPVRLRRTALDEDGNYTARTLVLQGEANSTFWTLTAALQPGRYYMLMDTNDNGIPELLDITDDDNFAGHLDRVNKALGIR